jgi:hypothetical protein
MSTDRTLLIRRTLATLAVSAAVLSIVQAVRPAFFVRADGNNGDFPIRNPIDRHVLMRLDQEKIPPSPLCSDEEFIRRAYLDVCGSVPPRAEVTRFMSDKASDKRDKLVDALLASERYSEHWSVMWSDLLREHSNSNRREGTQRGSYREWLQEALRRNMPYDQFARELIVASGSADENGAVNFYLRDENNRVETVNTVATVFMGTRMSCAQCHDHPFDKWTQNDFHNLAAYFGRTNVNIDAVQTLLKLEENKRLPDEVRKIMEPYFVEAHEALKKEEAAEKLGKLKEAGAGGDGMGMNGMQMMAMNGKPRNYMKEIEDKLTKVQAEQAKKIIQNSQVRQVVERPNGDYRMPAEGDGAKKDKKGAEIVPAVFPWNSARKSTGPGSRRRALADAIVTDRQFAAVQVNRIWAQLMGRGIVDPVDDFREKNPPSHPELLSYLTDEFIKAKFDNKFIIKLIMNSSTYQRSSTANASNKSDTTLYSHHRLRRMTAEQVFDSILVATGRENGIADSRIFARNAPELKGKGPNAGAKKIEVQWAADLPTPARTGTFMNTFNQPNREQVQVSRDQDGSIAQALEMLNGRAINDAIRSSPVIADLLDRKMGSNEVITELYQSVLTRNPSTDEVGFATKLMKGGVVTREWIEDLYWALLNSREFMFVK